MATRTYKAFGLNWDTWIELTGEASGPIVLTRTDGKPHAYAADEKEANSARFGAIKGHAIDRIGQTSAPAFVQEFSPEVLQQIKIVSEQTYPKPAEESAASASTDATPAPSRSTRRRRASGE